MINLYNANNHDKNVIPPPVVADSAKIKQTKSKVPAFEKYVDPTGELPANEFKWGVWYVKHKILLYKILVGSLIGFSVITVAFSIWQWGSYLLFGITADQALEKSISANVNYQNVNQNFLATPLQVAGTQILVSGMDRYDLVSEISNPNPRFLASFDYHYLLGGGASTTLQHALLLPGETGLVAYLGHAEGEPGAGATLVLSDVSWKRINAHAVPDAEKWQKDHLNFSVRDFNFTAYRNLEGANAHVIQFKFTNDSIYNYDQPDFYVGLMNDANLVGILPWRLDKLRTGETISADLRSFAPDLNVSDVKVYPLINVYDQEAFLPAE